LSSNFDLKTKNKIKQPSVSRFSSNCAADMLRPGHSILYRKIIAACSGTIQKRKLRCVGIM
jgi:hypothetical protein